MCIPEQLTEELAESRGYDRGYTAGTRHSHELLDKHIQQLKQKRCVLEEDGKHTQHLQTQINTLEQAKLIIRTGH